MYNFFIRSFLSTVLFVSLFFSFSLAQSANDLIVVPEGSQSADAKVIDLQNKSNYSGSLWDEYDRTAYKDSQIAGENNLANQIRTWIMTWDTLIFYLVFLLQLLSQVGILVWVLMIIFVGYQYASYSIANTEPNPGYIYNAIIGIFVIIFSYAILNLLQNMFL